jgi:hypothetical protein
MKSVPHLSSHDGPGRVHLEGFGPTRNRKVVGSNPTSGSKAQVRALQCSPCLGPVNDFVDPPTQIDQRDSLLFVLVGHDHPDRQSEPGSRRRLEDAHDVGSGLALGGPACLEQPDVASADQPAWLDGGRIGVGLPECPPRNACPTPRPIAWQPNAVDTDRCDATLRLTLNPWRTAARGLDGWTDWTPVGCCCASPPRRPEFGPGPSAASSRGFGPTVTIDR